MNEDAALMVRALSHYKIRVGSYRDDEGFKKRIQKAPVTFLSEKVDKIAKGIADIAENMKTAIASYPFKPPTEEEKVFLRDALKQYENDLLEIKEHMPPPLRSVTEKEINATKDISQRLS